MPTQKIKNLDEYSLRDILITLPHLSREGFHELLSKFNEYDLIDDPDAIVKAIREVFPDADQTTINVLEIIFAGADKYSNVASDEKQHKVKDLTKDSTFFTKSTTKPIEDLIKDDDALLDFMIEDSNDSGRNDYKLYNSGFKVRLDTITTNDIDDLNNLIKLSKKDLGLSTAGLAYSNSAVLYYETIYDFFITKVINTNISDVKGKSQLKYYIINEDIDLIIIAILKQYYGTAFPINRMCSASTLVKPEEEAITDEEKAKRTKILNCTNLLECEIEYDKLVWLTGNHSDIIDEHFALKTVTKQQVKDYQKKTNLEKETIVSSKDNYLQKVIHKKPNMDRMFTSGNLWINSVQQNLKEYLTEDVSVQQKNLLYTKKASVSSVEQFLHYMDRIEFIEKVEAVEDEDGNTEESEPTVEKLLKSFKEPKHMQQYVKKLKDSKLDLINEAVVTYNDAYEPMFIIGLQDYYCPDCSSKQTKEDNMVIPYNVLSLFLDHCSLNESLLIQ